jgi:predicted nucleotide-binding protein (sugar kinase/HSP70/actin superfamily)
MMHLVQRQAQKADIPFMCLTLEEHTAEAGVVTRLEAFIDMILRRTKKAK